MAHKRRGQLTVSPERAQHLRPLLRRAFWKAERQAQRVHMAEEASSVRVQGKPEPVEKHEGENVADIGQAKTD